MPPTSIASTPTSDPGLVFLELTSRLGREHWRERGPNTCTSKGYGLARTPERRLGVWSRAALADTLRRLKDRPAACHSVGAGGLGVVRFHPLHRGVHTTAERREELTEHRSKPATSALAGAGPQARLRPQRRAAPSAGSAPAKCVGAGRRHVAVVAQVTGPPSLIPPHAEHLRQRGTEHVWHK